MRATAEIDPAGTILVDVSPRETPAMRTIPGARYVRGTWQLPLTWAACLQLRGTFGQELAIGPGLREWAGGERSRVAQLVSLKEPGSGVPRPYSTAMESWSGPGNASLELDQRRDAAWLIESERALLALERGVGKTVSTCGGLRLAHELDKSPAPVLVVAGKSMLWTWAEEIQKWWPAARVAVVSGTAKQRREKLEQVADGTYNVAIISWGNLRHHSRQEPYGGVKLPATAREDGDLQAVQWNTVVFDEVHRMKDPKAHQTRAAWYLGRQGGPTYVWGLTGTPIADNAGDIWSIMHGIRPMDWPVKSAYIDRYCWVIPGPHGGIEILGLRPQLKDELFGFLDPYMLRRIRNREYTVHPPEVRYLELDAKQRKGYEAMRDNMIVQLESGLLVAADPLVQSGRLQQLAAGTPVLDEEGRVTALTLPSVKVDALLEIIEEKPGEPLVVFSASRKLIDLASSVLSVPHVLITGGQTERERYDNVAAFQSGKVDIILLTAGAGSEGITLTRANTTVYLDRSWSMIQNEQSEGRIDRWGQTRDVFYIDLIAKGTVEEKVHKAGDRKAAMLQEFVRDPVAFLQKA